MTQIIGVYLIQNTVSGVVYVGSSSRSIPERWYNHQKQLREGRHGNSYLQSAWKKYGSDAFIFTILEVCSDPDDVIPREQYWIDFYMSQGIEMYNLTPTAGSNRGWKQSLETLIKRATKLRGQKRTDEARKRMSDAWHRNPPSPETLRKGGEKRRGRARPQSVIDAVSKTYDGFVSPDGVEYRDIKNLLAFCKAHKLDSSAMTKLDKGLLRSVKGWRRIDMEGRKHYAFISPDGIRYDGITVLTVFCREHDLNNKAMSMVDLGKRRHHKGWTKG